MYSLQDFFMYSATEPMIFTRFIFWVFFAVLLVGYSFVYKRNQLRLFYLLAFSLFFYYKSGGYFFFLLLFSTIFDYGTGNLIHRAQTLWKRKAYMLTSISVNLFILCFFKYAYFFSDIFNDLFGLHLKPYNFLSGAANAVTGKNEFDVWQIILPVGISFYTFQTISYAVDIYRRKIEPAKNMIDFGFFVTYFPQLVAGPIVRAAEFMPQMYKPYNLTKEDFNRALYLIVNGLMKKILISDYISMNFVDRVFESPDKFSGFENLMAVYGYSMQIYCDFSGYTDIAIGVSLLLGFTLPINFNSPYKARNITDFWRRWHISLSTWLRDYLYIPLGGNRKGNVRTYINLILTMVLGGFWHGAHVRFLIWGALHGGAQAFYKLFRTVFPATNDKRHPIWAFFSWLITFHFVAFCWIYFRAADLKSVNTILSQIFYSFHPELIGTVVDAYRNVFLAMGIGYLIHLLPERFKNALRTRFMEMPAVAQAVGIAVLVIVLYQVSSMGSQPFIYFQF